MFQVAVVLNENEVAHSVFADTVAILRRPGVLADQKARTYRFSVFDKYNIDHLFSSGGRRNLANFDSMIIATNACNNLEILSALRSNAGAIGEFLGNARGILICSQKKLSQRAGTDRLTTGFLPDRYEYSLYDRPEASSAGGAITIAEATDRIFLYPNHITDPLIEYHCTNNSFMAHKYRSHVVPQHPSQYLPLLTDTQSPPVDEALRATLDLSRALLLRAGSTTERLVVSSMAIDWAGHEELLENLLVYITEGTTQIAVLRRRDNRSRRAMDAFVTRARVAKIPVREYLDTDPARIAELHHQTLIVSPEFTTVEVEQMWSALTAVAGRNTDLYHMSPDDITGGFQLSRRSQRGALDSISASAGAWLGRSFVPNLWGRSIWTYNYVLPMMLDLRIDVAPYLPFIFEDTLKHVPGTLAPLASYDNVTNASAQLLEILDRAYLRSGFSPDSRRNQPSPQELFTGCSIWLLGKLVGPGAQPLRDRLYILNALSRVSYISEVDEGVRRQIWASAIETLNTYRTNAHHRCDTVELTQILELALVLGAEGRLSEPDLLGDVASILSVLRSRQQADGEWRNISETAEVTLALLRLAQQHPRLADDYDVTEAILQGVGFLLRDFDTVLGNWRDDINATAKAAHALALFDRQSGASASDLFADIQARMTLQSGTAAVQSRLDQDGTLLTTLFRSESLLSERATQLSLVEARLAIQEGRLHRQRIMIFAAVVVALITGSTLVSRVTSSV